MNFFRSFTIFILKNRKTVLFLIGIITILFFFFMLRIKIDFTIEKLFPLHDPDVDYYLKFRSDFEREDRVIYLAFRDDSLFTRNVLTSLDKLSDTLKLIEGIDEIISLTTVNVISGDSAGVKIFSPYESWLSGEINLHQFKEILLRDSIWVENIISRDGTVTGIFLKIAGSHNFDKARAKLLKTVRQILKRYPFDFYLAGFPVIRTEYVRFIWKDWGRFIPLIIIIMSLISYLHFRSGFTIIVPMVVVLLSSVWTLGLMSFLNISINIISYLVPALIVVVGVSDSVHIFNRYREGLLNESSGHKAIIEVMSEIGMAIFLTSFTTAVGFSALSFTNIQLIREFGLMVAFGVICAFLLSVTLVPILMTYWKKNDRLLFVSSFTGFHNRSLSEINTIVMHKRNLITILVILIFVTAVIFAGRINPDIHFMDDIHHGSRLYKSHQFINRHLGKVFPLEIVLDTNTGDGIYSPDLMVFADSIESFLRKFNEIGKVTSVVDYLKEMNSCFQGSETFGFQVPQNRELVAQYMFLYSLETGDEFEGMVDFDRAKMRIAARIADCGSERIAEIVRDIRNFLKLHSPPGIESHVTGTTMLAMKTNLKMVNNLVNSFFIAFIIIAFTIVLLFRSWKLSLISIVPNIVPIVGLAGFMGLAGIHLRPSTAVTFAIAFGIAIDDTIHFITRFRTEFCRDIPPGRDQGKTPVESAIEKTILRTGYAMIATSEILVFGIAVLLISTFVASENFALLLAVTLTGALLGDLFLLPALILRFGKSLIKKSSG